MKKGSFAKTNGAASRIKSLSATELRTLNFPEPVEGVEGYERKKHVYQ